MKESGIETPSGDFTDRVMQRIGTQPVHHLYRPLIGKTGKVLILLFIAVITVLSLLFSGQGGVWIEKILKPEFSEWSWQQFSIDLDFLSSLSLSPWLVSTVIALFLLILTDAGVRRKKTT